MKAFQTFKLKRIRRKIQSVAACSYPVALTTDKENIGDYGNTDQIILFKNFDGDNSKEFKRFMLI